MANRKKNILLIAPNVTRDSSTTKWLHPCIGIYRIAGYLKKNGMDVDCFDQAYFVATQDGPSLEDKLAEQSWDIIGFSVLEESLEDDIAAMHLARKMVPTAQLVAGGIEAQYNYQNILDKSPCKIAILGEGEKPMLDLANERPIHEIQGIVFRNDAVPLSAEEFWEVTEATEYQHIPYEKYWDHYVDMYDDHLSDINLETIHTVRIFTRNYCPVGCKFCVSTNQLSDAAGLKRVGVVDVIDERLAELVGKVVDAQPRVRTVYFTDDDFCLNLNKVKSFCQELIKRNYPVSYICFARADRLDEETIALMGEAGFRVVNTGLESFSEEVWREYGNKYTKKDGYQKVLQNINLFSKYGITLFASVILCSPDSKLEQVEITAKKLLGYLEHGVLEAGVNVSVQPFKGSNFFETKLDFESEIVAIPGTRFKLRKDYFIRASDPQVRELQYRFLETYPSKIAELHKNGELLHATSSAQARLKLEIVLSLIGEIRGEPDINSSDDGDYTQNNHAKRAVEAIHKLGPYRSGSAL